ncbi:transcriptional regulator, GntR family [Actinokineospora alba]|uniref:Transcriptional regulator, GntR family n=1 Tax=Actinokineospora alba TaxID=504798 RepID=A0A1H0FG54_9PSEU|nr:PLP-dependent aminotransferase family protein [Actinokineospora alba]TDP69470.1 GntR family transcriptional regulator [Actinokineospora alba]SDI16083.1 GntR family transcriptional regulator / MocR family aminotransferase [Actinokineospora alba]SDN93683.1 transcriptional regulator, GntR family [Actinokineospora alba]
MDIHVTLSGRGDLAAQIYRQLLDAVLDGRLRPGERLPPSRELAVRLSVSRNTVGVAYDRLTAEGFLVGRVGAGTFVCDRPATRSRSARASAEVLPRARWRSVPAESPSWEPRFDFRVGVPDVDLFPWATWRRLVSASLRRSAVRSADYADPAGERVLREAVARHVGLARSVHAGPDDVVITQGAQQALDLIARVLIDPGEVVAVEEPGYLPARRLFAAHGARVVGVPVDDQGLVVAELPSSARVVYTTPSHQFPLGIPMSVARRAELLAWAGRRGAVVVEDDYDSEFRFSDRPLEPLQSLDGQGRVVYVGTFSKTLLPALRLGFLVAPPAVRRAVRAARQLCDWHGEVTGQLALAKFIEEGLLARHVRRAGREYGRRHARIVAVLERDFAGVARVVPSAAGLHVFAETPKPLDARVAAARGVGVNTLEGLCEHTGGRSGFALGFGTIGYEQIEEGLARLRECLADTGCPQ